MKKKIIFLILLGIVLISKTTNVHAETFKFYESDYVNNIWTVRKIGKTKYYQTARFFRQELTNNPAYCIEPAATFNKDSVYTESSNYYLPQDKVNNIRNIAYYGYGYTNHLDPKWYAITQFMIWQEADSDEEYYFTDSLNGNRIDAYTNEMNEIRSLINSNKQLPSIANKTYEFIEDNKVTIKDDYNLLNNYKVINNDLVKITNNTLDVSSLKEGTYKLKFEENKNIYNRQILFYESSNSQDMVIPGDIKKSFELTINVTKTKVSLTKIDKDIQKPIETGEASLAGSKFELLNDKDEVIKNIEIDDTKNINIENLNYGTYKLKETKPGTGYNLNIEIINFNLSKDNKTIALKVENEVIKAKINIKKLYGSDSNFIGEKDISFNIYNNKKELVKTIITDELGQASITLPYGKYTLVQLNTTKGYEKVSNQEIIISNNNPINIELKDYEIEVPNTNTKRSFIETLLLLLERILC